MTLIFDYLSLRGTPLNRFSKVLHVSAFANLLWTLTVIGGYISEFIINTNSPNINFVCKVCLWQLDSESGYLYQYLEPH